MAEKAHQTLSRVAKVKLTPEQFADQTLPGQVYNRIIGNSYSASLFIGFCSLLDNLHEDLKGRRISFFSYGSGCVAEFFTGLMQPGYQTVLMTPSHSQQIEQRKALSYAEYLTFYHQVDDDVENIEFAKTNRSG